MEEGQRLRRVELDCDLVMACADVGGRGLVEDRSREMPAVLREWLVERRMRGCGIVVSVLGTLQMR